jgi:regulator of protease activity HflC (stomatin/prohibitin superfamily)
MLSASVGRIQGEQMSPVILVYIVVALLLLWVLLRSVILVGPTQVGLVNKRVGFKRNHTNMPIVFHHEAGYQAVLLKPGLRFKLWPVFRVTKHPWVQVPAGEIGVVISQVGDSLPTGAKSAVYKQVFGDFTDLQVFLAEGGQKGVQRPVLPPGTLVPIHPVAFLVLTPDRVYGIPIDPTLASRGNLSSQTFGVDPHELHVMLIEARDSGDVVGIVTTLEGPPLPAGQIAGRIGGYEDIKALEASGSDDSTLIEALLSVKNDKHNNYQDFQAFLDQGGCIGLQHDPLLYGAYLLNPFLVKVAMVPMLLVNQGEVAVIRSYVGLPTLDTSGPEFKFGSIVPPGHRGIWRDSLRTGKYALNPRVYAALMVPTFILTLNWAQANSVAHDLDAELSSIEGKSREGFVFKIDLQVQIHVPDTKAPKVISMVGSMKNLVNEVLQAAVGNHFRNTLQALEAVKFIETRDQIQQAAMETISGYLTIYEVETKGVYIQDVTFPEALVTVLTQREIANQEKETYEQQKNAQGVRVELERQRGTADMQGELSRAQVSVAINTNKAEARKAEALGEAAYIETTGAAEGKRREAIGRGEGEAVRAVGLGRADAYHAQADALGATATALVAVAGAVSEGHIRVVPEVLVAGGQGSSLDGLAGVLMRKFTPPPSADQPGGIADAPSPVPAASSVGEVVVPGTDEGPGEDAPGGGAATPAEMADAASDQAVAMAATPGGRGEKKRR